MEIICIQRYEWLNNFFLQLLFFFTKQKIIAREEFKDKICKLVSKLPRDIDRQVWFLWRDASLE